ncbi:ABC transporter substrate-binding protein [Pseudonocardia sp. TRM90224]|uniref:ABC transporter substrate-binding protein n=1 Tax=Pseudonocardia sp. TRM90224 TaxID=2812678 RepID=UPI001E318C38|nr:ABC transporter substrate-binding protein [Pseudonocardia sp. TRM90224]
MARSYFPSRRAVATLVCSLAVAVGVISGCGGTPGPAPAQVPGAVAVPAGALVKDGEITYCSDISAPPLTFFDASQKAVGAEIELGDALAAQLGVRPKWANTSFNGIIPALQARQCDAIISQLYIKPEREAVVDFVPYMYASNTLMVANGNTSIAGAEDLCGKRAAGQTGTTVVGYLTDQSTKCAAAGKPPIDIRQFTKDSDALQQLRLGLVDSYGTTLETAAYVQTQQPGTFQLVGEPFNRIKVGVATLKGGGTALHDAIATALATIRKDGTYAAILAKWNLTGDDIAVAG